jgi:hypothetical protein
LVEIDHFLGITEGIVHPAVLEERIVPAAIRNNPLYNGFYFYLPTLDLNLKFKLVLKDKD